MVKITEGMVKANLIMESNWQEYSKDYEKFKTACNGIDEEDVKAIFDTWQKITNGNKST